MKLEIVWDHDDQEPEEPEYCPACGRPDTLTVTWPDVDDRPGPLGYGRPGLGPR